MDSDTVLGVAGRLTRVFAEEGTYLSFPLTPLGLLGSRLRAAAEDPLSPEGSRQVAEFSQLVNELPDGPLWQPDGDRLWDVYGDVLDDVELGQETPDPAAQARYDAAVALLYTTADVGTSGTSSLVRAYEQYRDAYLAVREEFANRQLQAATSADPVVASAWDRDRPVLAQAVATAEQDWAVLGHRAEVEDARRVLTAASSTSSALLWSDLRSRFDPSTPEIFFRTGPDGGAYLPTGYLPSDALSTTWPTMTIERSEMASSAADAPRALSSRIADRVQESDIEQVSFEYSSVTMTRGWLAPQVFGSRSWRFRAPGRTLSDGAAPPSGECTGYVERLVLARRITVRRRVTDAGPTGHPGRPRPDLGFVPTATLQLADGRRDLTTARVPVSVATGGPAPPGAARVAEGPVRPARAGMAGPRVIAAPTALLNWDHRQAPVTAAPRTPVAAVRPLRALDLPELVQSRRPVLPVRPPPGPGPQKPGTKVVIETTGPDEVYVIAFSCRLLPRCPDPDPGLDWSGG